jgi:hypothetical protein
MGTNRFALDYVFFVGVGLADEAFNLKAFGAEVEEEADGEVAGVEVVDANPGVFIGEPACSFQFNNNLAFDDEVSDIVADNNAIVINGNPMLLKDGEAEFAEFVGEGIFVDFFEEAGAEGGVDLHGGANDLFGHWREDLAHAELLFVGICAHLWAVYVVSDAIACS